MTSSRWTMISVLAVLLIGGGVLVASQNNYEYRFTETQLQEKLGERLPLTKTYLFIFDVTLDQPRVDLVEGSDRVAAGVDVLLNIKIGGGGVPLVGAVDVSGAIDYEPDTGEFFLTDPVIDSLRIQGVPDRYADQSRGVIESALSEYYEARPIYTLEGTDAAKMAGRLLLKDVTVKDEELIVTLGLNKNKSRDN